MGKLLPVSLCLQSTNFCKGVFSSISMSSSFLTEYDRPLTIRFKNYANIPINISSWNLVKNSYNSGKFAAENEKSDFELKFMEEQEVLMHEEKACTGVSGTFEIAINGQRKFVFFSNPFAGRSKIHIADSAEQAYQQGYDSKYKQCTVSGVNITASKDKKMEERAQNKSSRAFNLEFFQFSEDM